METLALVTAIAATGHDDDLVALLDACADAGLHARAVAWDDPTVGVAWPLHLLDGPPLLSAKDVAGKPLAECETFA